MLSRAIILTFAVLLLSMTVPAVAQSPDDQEAEEAYLRQSFEQARIPLPQLGWILPSGELVTELSAPALVILSTHPDLVIAHHPTAVPTAKIKDLVKSEQVDCDQTGDGAPSPLYRYQTGLSHQKVADQVFVVTQDKAQAKMQAYGLPAYTPTAVEQAGVWKALLAEPTGRHRFRSIAIPGSPVFYTVAATYNRKGIILRSGIFLEDHSGHILGREIQNIQGENQCDGCAVPSENDGINAAYDLENLLTLPGLAYPALLINSSTAEGRAIELFTFSPKAAPSRFRLYEYMVTCILGSAEEQAKPR